MTKKSASRRFGRLSTAAGLAVLLTASAASAQCVHCRPAYQPGLVSFLFDLFTVRPAPQPGYQGDYMVNHGPYYSGPAVIAPQPTYAPAPTASGYPYVSGYPAEPVRIVRPGRKGAPEVVRARAEVTIYGPERMDIHLFRE